MGTDGHERVVQNALCLWRAPAGARPLTALLYMMLYVHVVLRLLLYILLGLGYMFGKLKLVSNTLCSGVL